MKGPQDSPTSSRLFSAVPSAASVSPTMSPSWTWREYVAGIVEDFSYLSRYIKADFAALRAGVGLSRSLTGKATNCYFFARVVLALLTGFVWSVSGTVAAGCAAWWRGCGQWYAVGVAFLLEAVALSYYVGMIAPILSWAGLILSPIVLLFVVAAVVSFWIARGARNA